MTPLATTFNPVAECAPGSRCHTLTFDKKQIMKPLPAIVTTLGILILCIGVAIATGFDVIWLMIVSTAIWIAIDSKKIEIGKYKSGISYGPVVLFIATCLLGIVAFPWYLVVKERIKSGRALLKEERIEQGGAANPLPPSASGDS